MVHRHRDVTGGTIRAAVFGVSDGLVSNVALILGVDRILDMLRTTTNVTGDAAVYAIIAHSEKQLHPPSE